MLGEALRCEPSRQYYIMHVSSEKEKQDSGTLTSPVPHKQRGNVVILSRDRISNTKAARRTFHPQCRTPEIQSHNQFG